MAERVGMLRENARIYAHIEQALLEFIPERELPMLIAQLCA